MHGRRINNSNFIFFYRCFKSYVTSVLSMMRKMIMLVIFFAILLGVIIIYNMGILSYSEKQYQFATLKVLGFTDKKIKHVFIEQNIWMYQ